MAGVFVCLCDVFCVNLASELAVLEKSPAGIGSQGSSMEQVSNGVLIFKRQKRNIFENFAKMVTCANIRDAT